MAPPEKQGKAMSSRLLTMKFMQRAAKSPNSASETSPEPPSKKQRLSNGSRNSTPSSTPRSDAQAVQEALAEEERIRNEALDREAADRGDTKWYLSFQQPQAASVTQPPLQVISAGYSTLDATESARPNVSNIGDQPGRPSAVVGRRSFGKFNRALEKQQNGDDDLSELESDSSEGTSASEEDDDDESDDPDGTKAKISKARKEAGDKARAERKAKRRAEKAEIQRLAEERRKKQPTVNLNKLSSISGTGGARGSPTTSNSKTCYKCGKPGHMARDCGEPAQSHSNRR